MSDRSDRSDRSERGGDEGANADSADDELEVSPLDANRSHGAGDHRAAPGVSALTSLIAARLTPHRRVMAAVTAGGVVALALVVVLTTIPNGGGAVGALFSKMLGVASATPTAKLNVGSDTVGLIHSVPWGILTVDGRTVDLHTLGGGGNGSAILFPLLRGRHPLVYTAALFPTVRCQFSVPAAVIDTCPLSTTTLTVSVRTVDLQATPDHLPTAPCGALLEAVHAMVAQLVIPDGQVEPGDHYQSHSGATMAASEPLTAHTQVALSAPPPGFPFGKTCNPLCVLPGAVQSAPVWDLVAPITEALQLTDAHGTIVDTVPFDVSSPTAPSPFLLIETQWTGAWSVRLASPAASVVADNLCASGESQLQRLVPPSPAIVRLDSSLSTEPAAGCLIRATLSNSSRTPSAYLFFARYGALMAADDATQRALPRLARPSPNERTLIAQITL